MLWGREEEGKEINEMNQQRGIWMETFSGLVPEDLCGYVSSVCGDSTYVLSNQVVFRN